MGSITTGIGLISGINTGQLIDSLILLESGGKINLQKRIAALQSQRTALMDINARLLNLKNASKTFRIDKIFQSALAASSDETILTATANKNAQPGTFQFIVKQLVATSQRLTQGYADRTTTPLGLTSLSFEFGKGRLAVDRDLEQLNAGAGVDRGRIKITDRSGAEATIDLTDVTTLNEVLDRINAAAGVQVTASVEGDHLVITDTSGATTSNLIVANGTGDTTATDLGIASSVAANTITGGEINNLGLNTSLASLNDGNGVLTRNNVADIRITARDGTVLDIDFGRVNTPISNATLLADLNNGLGVKISTDEDNPDFKFVDREGTTHDVNLTGVTTVGGLANRVSIATGGKVTISVHADGKRLVVTDNTGATTSNLKVLGAGTNAEQTATDLGILNVAGAAAATFDGEIIPNTITTPPASKIGDIIDRINNTTGNGGKVVASLAADGVSLLITDTTGGVDNLKIRRTASNQSAAASLGIETDEAGVASNSVDGDRLIASLGSVLVKYINGGSGLGSATSITLEDRTGQQITINNLDTYDSLSDIISAINTQAAAGGVDISISLNTAGNGLLATDASGGGGNLIISGDGATALGIATDPAGVAADSQRGSNLQHRYVSEATKLSDLNYGRGVGLGKFRITDGLGESATVDIGSDSVTLQDVIEEINSRGLAIRARINDTGDGLVIEADLDVGETASTKIKIEAVSGSTAKDLNILGTSSTVEDAFINGSYERTVTLADSDTLDKVVKKINDANIPVSASVINAGSGATPFRINFTSKLSGTAGELLIDSGDIDLGLATLTKGQNAKVFFGVGSGGAAEDGFLVTSTTNSISTVIDGVTIDLLKASADPVTLTISRDTVTISAAVKQMVTTFNDAVGRINQYDFFDVDTQQRGALLGNPTTSRVREALFRIVQGKAMGVTTQYQYLRQAGITIGSGGQLQFDEAKFEEAYSSDPEAMENLFAAFQASAAGPQEVAPGVTVQNNQQVVTVRGFGELFDHLLEGLTNSIDGVVTVADKTFGEQIESANKRIAEFDLRLEAKRKRLQAQFAAMEAALARMQGQGNALASLANNVLLSQNLG